MADIKVGDRVVGYGHFTRNKYVGTVSHASGGSADGWVLRDVDYSRSEGYASSPVVVDVSLLETPEPTRELIGKAPEVEGPKLVGPFKAADGVVRDANGFYFGFADSRHLDFESEDDVKIAEVIAKALNAYFGIEVE